MATGTLQARPVGGVKSAVRAWDTPQRLHMALVATGVGAAIFFVLVMVAVGQLRGAIQTVAKDAYPSIIAAQHIRASLADMDANAANEMIAKPGDNMDAIKAYEDKRGDVADNIVNAAQNITYPAEREQILKITQGFAQYEELIAQSRSFHERGDAAMLASYRQATVVLHTMLDDAMKLDKINNDELEAAYGRQRLLTGLLLAVVFVAGFALLAVLVRTQLFLLHHMNRIINPGLLGATALLGLFLLVTLLQLAGANSQLKTAKEDAFDSIHALWQARAVAFDGNGAESRWLLDRPWADKYAKQFYDASDVLVKLKPGENADPVAAARSQGKGNGAPLLATEINNVTFPGEKEAAEKMLRAYAEYFAIDGEIRRLHLSGDHDAAVALCIGADPHESNWAFDEFDKALDETMQVNQTHFDEAVASGQASVRAIGLLNPFIALGIVLLAFVGLRPRMQEYNV
jgi:hypothetical protein